MSRVAVLAIVAGVVSASALAGPLHDAASRGDLDPERAWRIIEGKLYFVYDPTYVEELDGPAREEWLASAEANWPKLKARIEEERFN